METIQAVSALSALAHEGRLTIFRQLVQAGPEGMNAGALARSVGIAPNSLTVLSHAGLVSPRRDGRSIIYTAVYGRMSALLGFLLQDCCNGSPEICSPLVDVLQTTCCTPPLKVCQ